MTRGRIATALGMLVALAACTVWLYVAEPFGSATNSTDAWSAGSPTSPDGSAAGIPGRPADAFALTVDYVYDGDTIRATMVTPNEIVTTTDPIRIRLIGVDTPEGTPQPACWADQARTNLSAMLPVGATVWAAPDRDTWDDYRRRLFYLWTDDGRFVEYELAAAGDAQAIRIRPNVAHYELLAAAQQRAMAAGVGQWGAC